MTASTVDLVYSIAPSNSDLRFLISAILVAEILVLDKDFFDFEEKIYIARKGGDLAADILYLLLLGNLNELAVVPVG